MSQDKFGRRGVCEMQNLLDFGNRKGAEYGRRRIRWNCVKFCHLQGARPWLSAFFRGVARCATVCVRFATLFAGVLVAFGMGRRCRRHMIRKSVLRTADQLIDEACRAKSGGQPAVAYALLHQVVRIAPDNSLARWQLGQVKVDNEWLSVEEAQRRAEADPRQAKYRGAKGGIGRVAARRSSRSRGGVAGISSRTRPSFIGRVCCRPIPTIRKRCVLPVCAGTMAS